MIIVHHLNKSRSKRVLWLLEELNMPYQLVNHQRDAQTNLAPDSLKAVHPLSKAPIIVDDGITLCESGAIMEYILNQSTGSSLRPAQDSPEYYAYLEWLHFAEGSLGLPIIGKLMMSFEERDGSKPMDGYIGKEIALDFNYIEQTLSERAYFSGGNFTAADIMMTFMIEAALGLDLLSGKKHTLAYLEKVQQRDAYKKMALQG